MVQQTPVILSHLSFAQNIALFRSVTREQVLRAAQIAGFMPVVEGMPRGLDAKVDRPLSTGEAQRLEIARAIVANPAVVILDEATSRLDSQHEQTLLSELSKLHRLHITTVVIAHRLQTIRSADHFVVLHQSKVVQQGSFQTLMSSEAGLSDGRASFKDSMEFQASQSQAALEDVIISKLKQNGKLHDLARLIAPQIL